jgi:hypothetical protein
VRHLPFPLVGLLAATTLAANLAVLDEVTTAPPTVVAGAHTAPAVDGQDAAVSGARDDRPSAAAARTDAARLQARAEAWQVQQEAAEATLAAERRTEAEAEEQAREQAEAQARAEIDAAAVAAAEEATARSAAAADATAARRAPSPAPVEEAPPPASAPAPAPSPTSAPARPAPPADDADDCDHRCRGERLYGELRIQAPPDWTVRFEEEHPSYLGLADSRTRTITIYLRASLPDRVLTWTMYHEVGHSHDFTYLNTAKRDRWSAARGYPDETWFGCNYCTDYETPAGDWAEAFASCHTGWNDQWRSELGGPPTAAQCNLLHDLRQP